MVSVRRGSPNRIAMPKSDSRSRGAARAGGLQQDVGRLDVAVDDALRVHGGQAGQQLVQQQAHEARRQRAVVPYEMDERAAGDQVHGEQDLVVVGGPAVGGEHMRVVDAQRLLADEPQQGVGVALLEDLRGDVAAPAVVPGAPDRADAAASDRIDQFVPAGEHLTHRCALLLPPCGTP
ncbi:hypothetical protein GCM10020256_37500 [Streptomyces thermocoprophilus]